MPLIEFVEDYLAALGVPSIRVNCQPGKTNLWATIGPEIPGGIVLSGHTDVVPVDGQAWTSDPFAALERDGRIYGRGSADMKGFLAACLALVPEFLGKRLRAPDPPRLLLRRGGRGARGVGRWSAPSHPAPCRDQSAAASSASRP